MAVATVMWQQVVERGFSLDACLRISFRSGFWSSRCFCRVWRWRWHGSRVCWFRFI